MDLQPAKKSRGMFKISGKGPHELIFLLCENIIENNQKCCVAHKSSSVSPAILIQVWTIPGFNSSFIGIEIRSGTPSFFIIRWLVPTCRIGFQPFLVEHLDHLQSGDYRHFCHAATRISLIFGKVLAFSSLYASRYAGISSLMFVNASSSVSP